MSLLINSIVEKEEDKIQFLKEIISNKILNQNAVSLLKTEDLNVLLESDPYFFLDIVNRLNELVEENKNKNVISYVLRCLKCLYYSEGTTFREFLKTAFIKGINLYLHKFANYIADKPLRKMNFLSIFLYIPINSIPLSVYVRKSNFYCILFSIFNYP